VTLDEIKAAVDAGKIVHWANKGYTVIKDRLGQYLIVYYNQNAIGLTHGDGVTMNGREDQFFLGDDTQQSGKGNDDQQRGVLPAAVGQQQGGTDPGLHVGAPDLP
jgi:hypothetical protein